MSGDGRATILVVDDVPENVRLLGAVRAARGYDVVRATDGPAALELVGSANPDLVLLDVVMPQMDGYAVCRRLRAREETAVLPVIMLTSSTGRRRRRRSRPVRMTSSRSRSTTTSCSHASGRCCGSSATTTRSRCRPLSCST
jgi:CheY-like chemotaxis protein